ncbi:aldehyde reductase [Amycolatopsis acidicola]|uniref:Aldehyde reductase n=1 Tax=Amycolatopsis acidicola TaxID=2596893 RepID=A0A5N0UZL9_9PSEU|nr:aldehyde reductase [Amycolatopsis acidicola]KAA9157091.1 aldehyde reductase [Amycolatopsis acidicola]
MNGNTLVVVTGGTGHLGGHTIVRLLRDGYRVRTTVRSLERDAQVRAAVATGGADPAGLEVVAADLSADDGWAAALEGADYVLHLASPFPAEAPENDDDVIRPAVEGTLRVLTAAREAKVRRVVMTSSFAAVGYSAEPREVYTEADWTDPADPNEAYIRSKAIAERAAWDHVRENGGPELTVINPTGIFGPVLDGHLSSSVRLVQGLLTGAMPVVPRRYFGVVDVRDVADLHVLAMTEPAAAGRRFLAVAGKSISLLELAQLLGERIAKLPEESPAEQPRIPVIDNTKARTVLGWMPRAVETTIADTADSLLMQP